MQQTAWTTTAAIVLVPGASDRAPEDEDVVAGTWGLVMFLFLVVAMVLLMRSMLKQMRKADRAKDAGVYGDPPVDEDGADEGRADAEQRTKQS